MFLGDPSLVALRSLGHGGEADIILVFYRRLGRYVAAKVLREAWDPLARQAFAREVSRQVRVQQAGCRVATILAWNIIAPRPYALVEWMPKGSLHDRITSLRIGGYVHGTLFALEELYELAVGLADLHRHGVVHRDLKPGNVLVDNSGHLKLNDLGCGATMGMFPFLRASHFYGTPLYAAPEQFRNFAFFQSDVFALGLILYEMLMGQPLPRRGPAVAWEAVPWPSVYYPDCPPVVDELIRKLAHPDIRLRPLNGEAAAHEIYQILLKTYQINWRKGLLSRP